MTLGFGFGLGTGAGADVGREDFSVTMLTWLGVSLTTAGAETVDTVCDGCCEALSTVELGAKRGFGMVAVPRRGAGSDADDDGGGAATGVGAGVGFGRRGGGRALLARRKGEDEGEGSAAVAGVGVCSGLGSGFP